MIIELHRDYRDVTCTLGVMSVFGKRWQTMERPWVPSDKSVAGTKGVSCVSPGKYRLEPHNSEAHREVWALVAPILDVYHFEGDVPMQSRGSARTTVLIHSANYASELRGCIAPGKERRKMPDGSWMVLRSRDALNELRNAIGGAIELWIEIFEPTPI